MGKKFSVAVAATAIARETSDAYSFRTYGAVRWQACAAMLLRRGFTPRAVEAILRSKWTRWAADNAKDARRPNSADLARFIDRNTDNRTGIVPQVAELVAGTFNLSLEAAKKEVYRG